MTPALIIPAVSAFPPSFHGEGWLYGWTLFALTAISSFSLAVLGQLFAEVRQHGIGLNRPIGIVRAGLACLLLTILLGAIGDVAFLYAWGEVEPATLAMILNFDRACDMLTIVPFAIFGYLLTRGRPVIIYQLIKQEIPTDMWPTWPMVRQQSFVVLLILGLSMGVTIGK